MEKHRELDKKAYETMAHDKEEALASENMNFISFDLEKCLPLPKIITNVAYYKRQLSLYNLIIHLSNNNVNNGFMHIWTESTAGRGSTEIATEIASC